MVRALRLESPRRVAAAIATVLLVAASGCRETSAPVPVASVEVAPGPFTLLVGPGGGQRQQLQATLRDAEGNVLRGRAVTWTAQPAGIVTVSTSGLVTAVGVGAATVRAVVAEQSATVAVTVQSVPVARIRITNGPLSLSRSPVNAGTADVTATASDSTGATLANAAIVWQSSNPSVAAVSATGRVSAIGPGSAYVVAAVNAVRDSVPVTVTVVDTLPTGFDIRLVSARWTQGAQQGTGVIPMLLQGRDAVLNVMTASTAAVIDSLPFELRLYGADGGLRWSQRRRALVPAGSTDPVLPTVQFLVPAGALGFDLQWEVVRDPDGTLPDVDATTDRLPRNGRFALPVVQPPVLQLRFVPVSLTAHGGVTGNVSEANVEAYLQLIRQFGPVGAIEYTIAPPFASDASFGVAPTGGAALFWQTLLGQLDLARVASPEYSQAHWVGVVAPPAGFNFATIGGFAYVPSNGTESGPGTRTFALVHAGWFARESQTRELVMHELGHNLGRLHAPCGGAPGPDPAFPNPGGAVGVGGHDTYAFQRRESPTALAIPADRGDVMGYCSPVWISAYNYEAMVRFRGSAVVAAAERPARSRAIVVHGHVSREGEPSLQRAVHAEIAVAASADAGAWEAAVYDSAGIVLVRRRFEPGRFDHGDGQGAIALALPISPAQRSRAASVSVRSPTGRVAEVRLEPYDP